MPSVSRSPYWPKLCVDSTDPGGHDISDEIWERAGRVAEEVCAANSLAPLRLMISTDEHSKQRNRGPVCAILPPWGIVQIRESFVRIWPTQWISFCLAHEI